MGGRESADGADAFHHDPVMVREVVELLELQGDGCVVDGTVGGGGHAQAILERCPGCTLFAVDRDPEALEAAGRRLEVFGPRVEFLQARFDEAPAQIGAKVEAVQSVLLDLGMSSWHLDRTERGFAFRPGVPLDMRMGGSEESGRTAATLLNEEDEETLARIFREYGEDRRSRSLAREVVARRERRPFRTSDDLVGVLAAVSGRDPGVKAKARIFQALRIAVNQELEVLEAALPRFRDLLEPEGRLVVISYHSLEDRLVKNAFRDWSRECVCPPELPVCRCRGEPLGKALTPKPLRPSPEEVERNPRARSARLRGWRRAA